jgi:hypothetical protein
MSGLGWKLFAAGRMNVKKEKIQRSREITVLLDSVADTRKELAL